MYHRLRQVGERFVSRVHLGWNVKEDCEKTIIPFQSLMLILDARVLDPFEMSFI